MTEQGKKRNPFDTRHLLIESVRLNFERKDKETGELESEEVRSWGARVSSLFCVERDEIIEFADGDVLPGHEAADRIYQAFEAGLEPVIINDGRIDFNDPRIEG